MDLVTLVSGRYTLIGAVERRMSLDEVLQTYQSL
jgi:hypothetical protein